MTKNRLLLILINICFFLISVELLLPKTVIAQQNYGSFYIANIPGWNLNSGKSNSEYFVFEHSQSGIAVSLKKEPQFCENKQLFNAAVLKVIQSLPAQQEFMQMRKQAAPIKCLGQDYCHMIIAMSRVTKQKRFILNPYIGDQIYQVEISGEAATMNPPAEALNFVASLSLEPGGAVAINSQSLNQQNDYAINNQQNTQHEDDGLSAFKKNKSVAPSPPKPVQNNVPEIKNEIKQTNQPQVISSSAEPFQPDIKAPKVKIDKGNIPIVKFSATDPCAPTNPKDNGLPWETEQESKIELPKGVDAAIPDPIPNIDKLTDVAYNSAVSAAFEAMTLVYGEMPDDEAKKFQAAWAPLFDFPAQEIIDYLNKLNPLISQFVVCREAYIRNMGAINMVLLDANTALNCDDQQAWEAAMAEASMYASSLAPLDAAMKQLVKRLEALGNPPSPVDAKCEARRKYKKMLGTKEEPEVQFELEGEWVGFTESDLYGEWEKRQPLHVMFYSMPMVNEFSNETWTKLEGFSLRPDGGPFTPEWAGRELKSWDAPVTLFNWTEQMRDNIYNDKIDISYESSVEKPAGTETGTVRLVLERVDDELNSPADGINQVRIKELENIKEKLAKPREPGEPADVQLAMKISEIDRVIDRIKSYNSRRDIFHLSCQLWLQSPPLEIKNSMDDTKRIEEFTRRMQQTILSKTPKKTPQKDIKQEEVLSEEEIARAKKEEEARKESIAFHQEMTNVVQHNLDREVAERERIIQDMMNSKSKQEFDAHEKRLKQINLNIIHFQSNIQSEQDLIASYKTGELIHTRTAFDNYAQHRFIQGIQEKIVDIENTRRIAERINRQIELLPWQQQAKAREMARKIIDGKTIASGDVEKAKGLVRKFNDQIVAYADYDKAKAEEAEVDAAQNEFYVQMAIMVAGAGAMGFGTAALTEIYGAEAAYTIYGTKALGAIYGGTTGFIAGGPKEALTGAVSWWSPNGYALTQFVEGYQHAAHAEGATTSSQVWEGVKKAGQAWFLGKVFELGVKTVTKAALWGFGKDSRLFKPLVSTTSQRQQHFDVMKSKQLEKEAEDIVKTYEKLELELMQLKLNETRNATQIAQLEAELQQLTASMNASYHAKWRFKYKADAWIRRKFDARVQQNYANMEPGMVARMEAKGYKMDRIAFRQFRNGNSGGTSSMDLDLVPVQQGTGKPRNVFMKKDGTVVSAQEFMDDCQKAMHAEYYKQTGITAKSSDMNLVTSAHREAFATSKLLDHNIDMSSFTEEEIQSIGEVLKAKKEGIDANQMLTQTNKTQAKCREAAKEIENMLLRKLRSDLQNAPPGSPQAREIQGQIDYWEKMLGRLKQIGMQESDPLAIINLCNDVRRETGGKDANMICDDVISFFGAK